MQNTETKEMQMYVFLLLAISSSLVFDCSAVASDCTGQKNENILRVAQHDIGYDHFTTIQDAIDAIPTGNNRWMRIRVSPGIYREKVDIPVNKNCIILQGNHPSDTIISCGDYGETDQSATFTTSGDNFQARRIGFVNTAGLDTGKMVGPALAIRVYGDKSQFYKCNFVGYQDTIWDVKGRHYFKNCYIEGAIDFIWGDGQSVYEDCRINVTGPGFITAQARKSSSAPSGFVFLRGSVFGRSQTALGRAYRRYSRVIFMGTNFADIIQPKGWDAWRFQKQEEDILYAEVNCTGPGANLGDRVKWSKKSLNPKELAQFTLSAFIDQDGWIDKRERYMGS